MPIVWLLAVVIAGCVQPQTDEQFSPRAEAKVVPWVAAANPHAVDAGLEVLANGGSAVDAAIAVQSVLGLVEPQSSGIGGGAMMMVYDARSRRITSFNGRETAPAAAKPDMFLDEHGAVLPRAQAITSGRATGVPGVVRMLEQAHRKFGARPWAETFQPAIRLANSGFIVSPRMAHYLNSPYPQTQTADVRRLFSGPDGSPLRAGDRFVNQAYARTLSDIASNGARALYQGPIAEAIVARTRALPLGGEMTLEDLSRYTAEEVEPLCRIVWTKQVCVPPPPSSGVGLLQLLALLQSSDIGARGPRDPLSWFVFAQASRVMYADRDRYVADPRFVAVPVTQMLDPSYIADRARLIGNRAGAPPEAGTFSNHVAAVDATFEAAGTSHFVIVDAAGMVVSMTTTVETYFGSGRVVGGFVLNNQMTDFALSPIDGGRAAANAVAGGKRPRSSMAPVIVLDGDDRFVAALGSPGGNAILAYNGKTLLATLGWNMPLPAAIELPNLIARGGEFVAEIDGLSPDIVAGLAQRGVRLRPPKGEESGLHGVWVQPDGSLVGAADSRREGVARALETSR